MARPKQLSATAMRILCAWCCREGLPGYLGEREPLDDPQATHGVCAQHKALLLESLPSRSFPEAELLIIVHRHDAGLYEKLTRVFAGTSRVKVIADRRVSNEFGPERARRIREGTVSPLGGWTIVRFTPRSRRATRSPGFPPTQHIDSRHGASLLTPTAS